MLLLLTRQEACSHCHGVAGGGGGATGSPQRIQLVQLPGSGRPWLSSPGVKRARRINNEQVVSSSSGDPDEVSMVQFWGIPVALTSSRNFTAPNCPARNAAGG